MVRRCLQGEEVSLDVQGVRERVLRIGRVVQVVGDAEGAEFCARWLIGMSSALVPDCLDVHSFGRLQLSSKLI